MRRRPEITVWGDSRSMPYTEGQAVIGPGQIGPAPMQVESNLILR